MAVPEEAPVSQQKSVESAGVVADPMKKYLGKPQGPDSMRAWIVAIFSVLYVFFGWCAFSSTPVLYVAVMKTNPELTRELASWPFTVMSCCSFTGSESHYPAEYSCICIH